MANFGLIGYIHSMLHVGERTRVAVSEYLQGKADEWGEIKDEKMETWYIFFPKSSRRHLLRFKSGDAVIVKGTIHQTSNDEYKYAVNGECIKHFYTRNLMNEIKRERIVGDESPDLQDYLEKDF